MGFDTSETTFCCSDEVWKQCHPNYECSTCGRTRNYHNHRILKTRTTCKRIDNNYQRVWLSYDGSGRDFYVGVLIATTFLGPPPIPDLQANHLDGNVFNNHLSNLSWDTRSENLRHAWRHNQAGKPRRYRRTTEQDRQHILTLWESGLSMTSITTMVDWSFGTISKIVRAQQAA